MKRIARALFFATLILPLTHCTEKPDKKEDAAVTEKPSLKSAFSKDFTIGAAINGAQIMEEDTAAVRLLKTEFNSITPENVMKW
ncbi:MAG: endo-1,4-beta-xylanase, partial [Pricia sp.]